MDIVCLGELLIDFFPNQVGLSLSEVTAFLPKPGGAPANVAVAASRLGYKSAFIGKVGQDEFGKFLSNVLKREKVDIRGLRFDPKLHTTLAFLSKPDENTYDCLFYRKPGADTNLRPDELDENLISNTRAFQFGSLSLTDEPSRSATRTAIGIAHKAGALVCYDINYRPTLWKSLDEARKIAMEFIPLVDMVKVNETELSIFGSFDSIITGARKIRSNGPEMCVVTLGEKGSYIQTPLGEAFVPAILVEVVDAAGCGDAFLAGLLCKIIEKPDWRVDLNTECLHHLLSFANAVGALTATVQGAIPAMPTEEEVEEFIRRSSER